jgi:hypothetical protein
VQEELRKHLQSRKVAELELEEMHKRIEAETQNLTGSQRKWEAELKLYVVIMPPRVTSHVRKEQAN